MTKIKILIEGYAKKENGYEIASSAATLIIDNDLNIIVDPGMNRKLLLESLQKNNLTTKDIDYVILSHSHIDHTLLAGIFENVKIMDGSSIYSWGGKIEKHDNKVPKTNIAIIKTPGHDRLHCSVLVDTEEFGKVAIVADLFWWTDNKEQKIDRESLLDLEDPYATNESALRKSRAEILKIADYIIPGHGKPFKVQK